MKKECGSCTYFHADKTSAEKLGLCRRYAPRPVVVNELVVNLVVDAQWPVVYEWETCGEYK